MKKVVLFLSNISILASPLTIVACSNSSNNSDNPETPKPNPPDKEESLEFSQKIDQYIEQGVISFDWKFPVITQSLYEKYKKNYTKMQDAINFINKSSENLSWKIINIEEKNNQIIFNVTINNGISQTNKNFILDKTRLNSTMQDYVNSAYKEIGNNTTLKDSYKQSKLIDLLENIKTVDEFIKTYINELTYLGLKIKITFPSQVVNFSATNRFKINIRFFDENNNEIIPQANINQHYLKLNENQLNIVTIIKQSEINNNSQTINEILKCQNLGQIFILKDLDNNNLTINPILSFSGKNIINEMNLTEFTNIEFGPNAYFDNNKINNIKFNSQAIVKNIKSGLFIRNQIKSIDLPKKVEKFNVGAFDANVIIKGIDSINNINKIYDFETCNLRLDLLKNEKELNELFLILQKVQSRNIVRLNKVYLPNFSFNRIINPITCEEIIFNSEFSQSTHEEIFNSDISNWTINKEINIPSSVISINKTKLPSQSIIHRTLNKKITNLIKNNELDLTQTFKLESGQTINLFQKIDELDNFFYTFNSQNSNVNQLNKIIIKSSSNIQVWSNSNFYNQISFFVKNKAINKKIIIAKHFIYINSVSAFNSLKSNLLASSIKLERELNDNFTFINNGVLSLKTINDFAKPNSTRYINQILIGYENLIQSIDTNDVNEIRNNSFSELMFNNVQINISNITNINERGFYNVEGLIFVGVNNFSPISIGSYAFYKAKLKGNINLSNLKSIETNAFYGCELSGIINLTNATKIDSYAFYNNKDINAITISNELQKIGSYSFYGCSIKNIDLKNVATIDSYAFYNNEINNSIDLTKVISVGSNSFAGKNSIKEVIGFNFNNNYDVVSVFGSTQAKTISFNNLSNLFNVINFDPQSKIFDWSNIKTNKTFENYLNYFLLMLSDTKYQSYRNINEIILPSISNIDKNSIFIKAIKHSSIQTINKLTWNALNHKNMNFNLNGLSKIKSLNEDFTTGIITIPDNAFNGLNLKNQKNIDLSGVNTIGSRAFYQSGFKVFMNTNSLNKIGDFAFNNDVEMEIGINVQIGKNAFSQKTLPPKVVRNRFFNNHFSEIYDQNTKILDFTKANINHYEFDSNKEWKKYENIGDYLLDGDIEKIILPRLYVLNNNLVSNLGNVEKIEFQIQNQQIDKGFFSKTTILNKPNIKSTNILFDGDNFFD